MVAAVIILYLPELSLLDRLFQSVTGQVDAIIAVDNTPGPSTEVRSFLDSLPHPISYIPLGDNMGIATAQNIGIKASISEGYSHVLLLDQDSALPPKMVESLLSSEAELLREGKEVAVVGPQFIDEKSGRPSRAIRHRYFGIQKLYLDPNSTTPVETDHIIASGSLMRTSVFQRVGPMRDDLFIDWVDIEWGMRARSMGYESYYIPSVVMKHSVGDSVATVYGRDIHLHNDLRNYYMLRNAVYLCRLKSMGWRWKINFAPRIPCYLVLYPFLSGSKLKNFKMLLRAIWDGLIGRLGRLDEK